jgi:hypothetical protein
VLTERDRAASVDGLFYFVGGKTDIPFRGRQDRFDAFKMPDVYLRASSSTACLGHGSLLCLPSQIILATEDVHDFTTPRRLAQSIGSLRRLCAIEATTIDLSRTLVPAGSLLIMISLPPLLI